MRTACLNIRTGNSLDTGITRTSSTLDRAREFRVEALARTDRNSLTGIESFLREARAREIHGVAGVELDLASDQPAETAAAFPLVLYAENETGFANLARLVTAAHLNQDHPRAAGPFITLPDLEQHHHGLIAQSPGLSGEVSIRILRGEMDLAERLANRLADVLGRSSLYLGLACYGRPLEARLAGELAALARRAGLATVAANEIDHLDADDAAARDLRVAIAGGRNVTSPGPASHFRSPAELAQLFRDHPGALENAVELAARCRLPENGKRFPHYPLPAGRTGQAYLASLCDWESVPDRRSRERLEHELQAIAMKGLAGYFLILRDLTRHARAQHVTLGPGRGAVTSSAVAYRLGITGIDPLAHGLAFEHFLAAADEGPPEFGIEIASNRRDEMLTYLEHRYGTAAVARAGLIDLYSPRTALQDSGRALGLSDTEIADAAAKASDEPGADLALIVAHDSRLARQYRQDERVRTWFNLARRLQGLPRRFTPHPTGVVLAPGIGGGLPVQRAADGRSFAQVAWDDAADGAWMKIDLPGRKDLVATDTDARQATLFDVSINIPETISSHRQAIARLAGQPSLVPRDLRSFLGKMNPRTLDDLATAFSLASLARSGRDLRDLFLNRRSGAEAFDLADDALEAVLGLTQGLLIDQEQIAEVAQAFAGFSVEEAEAFRRSVVSSGGVLSPGDGAGGAGRRRPRSPAIGDVSAIAGPELGRWQHRFIAGAVRRGVSPARAGQVFLGLVHAGRVAPERAWSVGEALILYQRAYVAQRKTRPLPDQIAMPWAGGPDSEAGNYRHTGTDGPR